VSCSFPRVSPAGSSSQLDFCGEALRASGVAGVKTDKLETIAFHRKQGLPLCGFITLWLLIQPLFSTGI
jgi:hypothetical protein